MNGHLLKTIGGSNAIRFEDTLSTAQSPVRSTQKACALDSSLGTMLRVRHEQSKFISKELKG